MKATIGADRPVFTLINTFEVEPEHASDVLASLRDFTEEQTRSLPGFVATSVHVSLDRTPVVYTVEYVCAHPDG